MDNDFTFFNFEDNLTYFKLEDNLTFVFKLEDNLISFKLEDYDLIFWWQPQLIFNVNQGCMLG